MGDHIPYSNSYSTYNASLRTWFLAFGLGLPAALILEPEFSNSLANKVDVHIAVACLVAGVLLQVFVAFINKYVAWCNVCVIENEKLAAAQQAKFGKTMLAVASLTDKIWIDLWIDIVTGVLFVVAINRIFGALT